MSIAAYAPREATRAIFRHAFPRRRARLILTRSATELESIFKRELIDAVVLDAGHAGDDTWRAAALAREFPSAPFFGFAPCRGADAPAIARCAACGFADVLAESVDDGVVRELVFHESFTARFSRAMAAPPPSLGLDAPLQVDTWHAVVAHAGRTVRTDALARALGLTREHLSRRFASGGAPNLKRVVDLVRLIAAAELAKNPGYDVSDVAAVLEFASPSHLATTTQRVAGAKPASLARLRAVDLIRRFADGRGRSRS
ncbi:MAG TPA: AraC family transcriptional regulator [Gemmatimonadaceae bacterium]|nr:AraC family transcriptional regulator [Gemmatimonadaceae bacterium]